jgi:hypothetical protein
VFTHDNVLKPILIQPSDLEPLEKKDIDLDLVQEHIIEFEPM